MNQEGERVPWAAFWAREEGGPPLHAVLGFHL